MPYGVLGLGVDWVVVDRFERAVARQGEGLLREILRPAEIERCRRSVHSLPLNAASFAAKEAFLKALGTGRSGRISWHDVEVFASPRPSIRLSGEAGRIAESRGVRTAHLSLARTRDAVAALVVLEGRLPEASEIP